MYHSTLGLRVIKKKKDLGVVAVDAQTVHIRLYTRIYKMYIYVHARTLAHHEPAPALGFRVEGLGFGGSGLGFRVECLGFRV